MMNLKCFKKRDTRRKLLCLLCILCCSLTVFAQQWRSGTVIDVNDEPIAGVNVVEKGTANGTVTDVDGNFSLSVAENAMLLVSYVGYIPQEISTLSEVGEGTPRYQTNRRL